MQKQFIATPVSMIPNRIAATSCTHRKLFTVLVEGPVNGYTKQKVPFNRPQKLPRPLCLDKPKGDVIHLCTRLQVYIVSLLPYITLEVHVCAVPETVQYLKAPFENKPVMSLSPFEEKLLITVCN